MFFYNLPVHETFPNYDLKAAAGKYEERFYNSKKNYSVYFALFGLLNTSFVKYIQSNYH